MSAGYGGSPVLHDIHLSLTNGQRVGLLGPNGAGKTTLLRAIYREAGILAGDIYLAEDSIRNLSPQAIARAAALVPQEALRTFSWTVEDWVMMGRYCHLGPLQRPGPNSVRIIQDTLDICKLTDLADRKVDSLSGGEWQRVQIARALAQESPLLLLDEPTNHLDLQHQVELFHLLKTLSTHHNRVLLVVLHDLPLAARLCDSVVILQHGRIVASGPPTETMTPEILESVFQVSFSGKPHQHPWELEPDWETKPS